MKNFTIFVQAATCSAALAFVCNAAPTSVIAIDQRIPVEGARIVTGIVFNASDAHVNVDFTSSDGLHATKRTDVGPKGDYLLEIPTDSQDILIISVSDSKNTVIDGPLEVLAGSGGVAVNFKPTSTAAVSNSANTRIDSSEHATEYASNNKVPFRGNIVVKGLGQQVPSAKINSIRQNMVRAASLQYKASGEKGTALEGQIAELYSGEHTISGWVKTGRRPGDVNTIKVVVRPVDIESEAYKSRNILALFPSAPPDTSRAKVSRILDAKAETYGIHAGTAYCVVILLDGDIIEVSGIPRDEIGKKLIVSYAAQVAGL
jgi:hypothetical protein